MKGRKVLAILAASVLGAAAVGGSAQAATFHDVELANLEEAKQSILENAPQETGNGGHAGINVKLEDSGRAIAGMLVPLDLSWIDNADIAIDSSMNDDSIDAVITASLNAVKLLSMNMTIDSKTMDMLMQVPELSDAVLKGNYAELVDSSATTTVGDEVSEVPITKEDYALMYQIGMNLKKNPPAPETLVSLVDRYCNIIFDAYEEGESGTETVTVEGQTFETQTVTGIMTQENAIEMGKVLLSTARDDEEIKGLLEQASTGTAKEGTMYGEFQSAIDELLAGLEEEPGDEAEAYAEDEEAQDTEEAADEPEDIAVKLYLDDQEKVCGVQLGAVDAAPILTMLYPSTEEWSGLDVTMDADTSTLRLNGSGQKADGVLTGTYQFSSDGKVLAEIQATQSANTKETGIFDGDYVITPVTDAEDESNPVNSLSGFDLNVVVHSDKAAGSGTLKLDVRTGGSSLINATLRSENTTDTVNVDIPADAQTYELTDDEAMTSYMGTMNPMNIISSLTEAGMPEDFMEQIGNMMSGGSSEDGSAEEEPAA